MEILERIKVIWSKIKSIVIDLIKILNLYRKQLKFTYLRYNWEVFSGLESEKKTKHIN